VVTTCAGSAALAIPVGKMLTAAAKASVLKINEREIFEVIPEL
jgi:hypothetical protein